MANADENKFAFDREKAVFEQNCAQLRTLVQEMHKKPIMAATLTGGLLAVVPAFKADQTQATVLLALIAIVNAFIAVTCLRLRDVIESYILKANIFSADFGMKGGRPPRSVLPWVGGFSVAFGYASMMLTMMIFAWAAPVLLFGWHWFDAIPFISTIIGLSIWASLSIWRKWLDERDSTLAYYDNNWRDYVNKTSSLDMAEIRDRFSRRLPSNARILDVGAGSGRDAKAFMSAGFSVVALEPSKKLASHLRGIEGLDVTEFGAEKLEEASRYDGIWACASLIHLDDKLMAEAMQRLHHALKPGGHLYMSFKDGHRFRIAADGRQFTDMTPAMLGQIAKEHGLTVVDSWQSTSKLSGTNEAPWNNVIGRKPA